MRPEAHAVYQVHSPWSPPATYPPQRDPLPTPKPCFRSPLHPLLLVGSSVLTHASFALQAESGPVLAGIRGGGFTTSEPASVGGGDGALPLDFRMRTGFTTGLFFAVAGGYPTEQRFWSWELDDYEPAVRREGEGAAFGVALGWTLPRLPRR